MAEVLGFNESTISRAISDKYLECEKGVFPFKDFFSNSIGDVATSEIKNFVERLVASEEHTNPWSDKDLHEKVEERFGIKMVRRSIAKYREELNIPPFKERRVLYKIQEK